MTQHTPEGQCNCKACKAYSEILTQRVAESRVRDAAPDTLKELKSLVARVQDILDADGVDDFYRDALQSDLEPAEAAIAKVEKVTP